jgi:hypothetical protein
MRTSTVYGGTLWVSDCLYYDLPASDCNPLSASTIQEEATTYQDVQRSGLAGLGAYLLAHRTGPLVHLLFHGRPALRFVATSASILSLFGPEPATIWLDARSRMLLNVQVDNHPNSSWALVAMHARNLTPGTLPADFFDPPDAQPSLWDRMLGCVRDRMAGR